MRRRYRKILFFASYSSEKKIYHGTKSYDKHVNKPQASDFKPITFKIKPGPELIIKSVLKFFTYLKFRNSFRGIDNYNFAVELTLPYLQWKTWELWITWRMV